LTALNLVGVPPEHVNSSVLAAILRGGLDKAKEAKCLIIGGHTIRNPEPIYGLAVTGLVSPRRLIANAKARPGDLLVLTKPLGTGIVTTAIKRGIASAAVARRAVRIMRQLNSVGADLAEAGLVRAGTDVTGFGLLGHLASLCRASGVSAIVNVSAVPALSPEVMKLIDQDCIPGGTRQNLKTADAITDWGKASVAEKVLLTDAQTSGGLLLCVAPKRLDAVQRLLTRRRCACVAVVGRIVRGPAGRLQVSEK
jgi:selenide,water dikinase